MNSNIFKTISVEWVNNEGDPEPYFINIEMVDKLEHGARGRFMMASHQKEKNALPLISLVWKPSEETIIHESFHACIDMFRTYNESFDDLFKPYSPHGEEAFICYSFDIANAIKRYVKSLSNR